MFARFQGTMRTASGSCLGEAKHNCPRSALNLPFRTLVDRYLTNYEDADFVAA